MVKRGLTSSRIFRRAGFGCVMRDSDDAVLGLQAGYMEDVATSDWLMVMIISAISWIS